MLSALHRFFPLLSLPEISWTSQGTGSSHRELDPIGRSGMAVVIVTSKLYHNISPT